MHARFYDKARVPAPLDVLHQLGVRDVAARGEWLSCRCLFPDHDDRHPSFSIHALSGAWRCFGCHRNGGDVIALWREITGASFRETLRALGVSS